MWKLFVATVALAHTASADDGFGAMVGVGTINYSNLSRVTKQPRPVVGVFYRVNVTGRCSLDAGATYAVRQLDTDAGQASFHDLELPVIVRRWVEIDDGVDASFSAGVAPWLHLHPEADQRAWDFTVSAGAGLSARIDPWRIGIEVRGAIGAVGQFETGEDGYQGTATALYLVATGVYIR